MNEDTGMGKTTRDRWEAERQDTEEKHVNKTRTQKKALEKCGFHLRKNNHKDEKIPVREGEFEEDTTWENTIIGGDNVRITTNNWGIWGNGMENRKVRTYTDGSVQKDVERAGFGWCLENDWFVANWRTVHEKRHRGHRTTQIFKNMIIGGGQTLDSKASYTTELNAIASAIMNIPGGWDLEIVTDSEAAIRAIDRKSKITTRNADWQLLSIILRLINARKGKTTFVHQESHKKLWTRESVGNATADLAADVFTEAAGREGRAACIPLTYNHQAYTVHVNDSGKILTQDLRKTVKRSMIQKADEEWMWNSTQGRIKSRIDDIGAYFRRRRKKGMTANHSPEVLVKVITQVHTQKPVKQLSRVSTDCEYCRVVKGQEGKTRDNAHEKRCEVTKRKRHETRKKIREEAEKMAKTKIPGKYLVREQQ